MSATQIRTPGIASHMRQLALEAGVDPSRIEVEITEGVLLADDEHTLTNSQRRLFDRAGRLRQAALCNCIEPTGRSACIGALAQTEAVLAARAGTMIVAES